MNELRAVSVTPTVLSVSLDQLEAIHSETASVADKMKAMSVRSDNNSLSPSHRKELEVGCLYIHVCVEVFLPCKGPHGVKFFKKTRPFSK